MRFTIGPEPLIKIVLMVGEWVSERSATAPVLRMTACAGRVYVESGNRAAEIDAAVWEDGQCTLSQARLLEALKTYRKEGNVTVQADIRGLLVGDRSMFVRSYHPHGPAPQAFQIFLATDSGLVSSGFAPAFEQVAAS